MYELLDEQVPGSHLLDATLIRGVRAPAAVAILGRWNWWLQGPGKG